MKTNWRKSNKNLCVFKRLISKETLRISLKTSESNLLSL